MVPWYLVVTAHMGRGGCRHPPAMHRTNGARGGWWLKFHQIGRWWVQGCLMVALGRTRTCGAVVFDRCGPYEPWWGGRRSAASAARGRGAPRCVGLNGPKISGKP